MEPGASITDASTAVSAVLTPAFLRKLDRLHLTVRRSLSTRPGNTPMPRGSQGSGIELENYKAYGAGDDLRHLDWNAYGRLDQLLIKTFRAEREAPLHIFIDVSASMMVPPADGKLGFSIGLAASLAYVSLRNHDPVRVVGLNQALPDLHVASPFFRHRQSLGRLRDFLLQLRPRGGTAPGAAVVLSDFLTEPSVYESALGDLIARRFTVAAVRVIGPSERDPLQLFRRGQLVDTETGQRRFVTLSPENVSRYRQALGEHLGNLQNFCSRCGIVFSVADTAAGLEQTLFRDLPAAGLLH
jgi:uncharacterized protein (DUF58 family)